MFYNKFVDCLRIFIELEKKIKDKIIWPISINNDQLFERIKKSFI